MMLEDFKTVQMDISSGIASVILNKPAMMNSLTSQMRSELLSILTEIEQQDEIRVVILSAVGKCFCAGADLAEGLAGYASIGEQISQEYLPIFSKITESSKLYIAALNGNAIGIGAGLALSCDLVTMSESACLVFPFASFGLVPDGGTSYQLTKHLGAKKALQVLVEATPLSAAECQQFGLANKVLTHDELMVATKEWAEKLAKGPPISHALMKQLVNKADKLDLLKVIELEAIHQTTASESEDSKAAVEAFFSKKPVVFKGK